MPRTLNSTLISELTRLSSDHVLTFLFEVVIPGAPGTLRYALYDQSIVFQGLTFTPVQAQVETLEDATSSALTTVRVSWQNITQEFVSLAEYYWISVANPTWQVTIWQIDAQQPDLVPLTAGEVFLVSNLATDLWQATAELQAEGLTLSMVLPKRRFSRAGGYPLIPQRV